MDWIWLIWMGATEGSDTAEEMFAYAQSEEHDIDHVAHLTTLSFAHVNRLLSLPIISYAIYHQIIIHSVLSHLFIEIDYFIFFYHFY